MVGADKGNDGWTDDDGLPGLPEEWGVIVIPDDASALAEEARVVRAELALAAPRTRWQRLLARPGVRAIRRFGAVGVRGPVLIIAMAVLVTVASLFAAAWPGPARSPATQRTATTTERSDSLPALELVAADGSTVALRGRLPAVVLVTDGCDCAALISDTAAAVRPEVAVIAVATDRPSAGTVPPTGAAPQAQGKTVRRLSDPTGTLRAHLSLGTPDGTAAALLVASDGRIVRELLRTASIEDFRADLARI